MTTEELEPGTLARANERLPGILANGGPTPLLDNIGPAGTPPKPRAPRSDKGKPRETLYIQTYGVRFDLADNYGRESFKREFGAAILEQGERLIWCMKCIDELLREIDRLRASK